MRLPSIFESAIVGIALISQQAPARCDEVNFLKPFVGETTREFEARKRGMALEDENSLGETLTVSADPSGHFFVEPTLDGRRIRMLVDTGASLVTLSHEDAELMLLRLASGDYTQKVATANGAVSAAPIHIAEMQIGGIVVRNVEALVLPPGRLKTSLLGMTFLKRLSSFAITDGHLVLRQ